MKKTLIIIIVSIFVLSAGCSLGRMPPADESLPVQAYSPAEAVSRAFDALKQADAPTFNALIQYQTTKTGLVVSEAERYFGSSLDDEGREYILAVFEKLDYAILSETIEETGAVVRAEITNRDLSDLDILRYPDADNPYTAAIRDCDATLTSTVDIAAVPTDAGWRIVIDDALTQALWGNKKGVLDALRDLFKR
ncbi:MAG: hypothetical protein LBV27_01605 [Oscillospiraceae bacterium]|jgi:hypothetical protein|nr:hypothetical protein [Oscillospiraceae bacterium]